MRFLNSKLVRSVYFIILIIGVYSCIKDPTIKIVEIKGPTAVCYGELDVDYSVEANSDADYILWTVPEQAQITSGQGTNEIKVNFGRKAGKVGVTYYKNGEAISNQFFIEVKFGALNQWCRELDFGGGIRTSGVGFSIGNKGYIGTGIGYSSGLVYYEDFWEFDPELSTWTQKADLGGNGVNMNLGLQRVNAVGFSIGNKGYIGTGHKSGGTTPDQYLKDFWEYTPVSNSWLRKADCSDTTRHYAVGFSIGNKGYVGSGQPATNGLQADFWEYDPATDVWTRKADIVPRHSGVGFSIGNKGYFGTGIGISQAKHNDFYEFDPSDASLGLDSNGNPLGKWTIKETVPGLERYGSVAFSIENKGYIGAGFNAQIYFNDFYEYDPILDQWDTIPKLDGGKREYAVGFSIGNKGYVGTGDWTDNTLISYQDFWVFTK